MLLFALSFGKLYAQTGTVNGLCVLVDFQDQKFRTSVDSVSTLFNQGPGATHWGHIGSVKQYFKEQSNGKLTVNTQVIKVAVPRTYAYYKVDKPGVDEGQEFVKDVINAVNVAYPAGFTNLTVHPTQNRLQHFFILKQVNEGGGVAFGLEAGLTIKNNGVNLTVGNVGTANWDSSTKPEANVICHEMGHSLFEWTDYYRTAWSNLGDYCVMASAGTFAGPMPINPALRYVKGWIDNVIEIGNTQQVYSSVSGNYNTVFKYTNPSNPKEYLIIHSQVHGGFYQPIVNDKPTDQGLAIYYVDENQGMDGNYNNGGGPFIRLVQADNKDEMHEEFSDGIRGDLDDLFDSQTSFYSLGNFFSWKNGGFFGLDIDQINVTPTTTSFRVVKSAPFYHSISTDGNGTVNSFMGVFPINSGGTRSFIASPNPGYEPYQIKVNGQIETLENSPLLTIRPTADGKSRFLLLGDFEIENANRNYVIEVSFRKKSTIRPIKAPWSTSQIGSATGLGLDTIKIDNFQNTIDQLYLESTGNDVWGASDQFGYIYQKVSGNGYIQGQLSSHNKLSDWNKFGLMIRESLNPSAKYGFVCYTPLNHTRIQQRINTNDNAIDGPYIGYDAGNIHWLNLYKWYKIEKAGNLISYFVSKDGSNWVKLGEQTIAFANEFFVGVAVSGSNNMGTVKAYFSNVTTTFSVVLQNCSDPLWNATTAYSGGAKVSYNGKKYTAQWWTQGNQPDLNTGAGKPWVDNGVCGGTSNVAPTVSITSPITGTSFNQPALITINATATDADGSIAKVEFYNGTTLLNTDVTAPYSFNWTNVVAANYSITAKAYDNLGLVTTSSSVLVTVNSGNNSCTVPTWNATAAYSAGASVVHNGIKYTANWWNQNQRPDLNNGPIGTGKPWTSNGNCSARIADAEPFNNQVEIYPNPSNGSFVVNTSTAGELEIKNAFGLTVFSTSLTEGKNVVETTLASGVYFVTVNQQVYKLVIE